MEAKLLYTVGLVSDIQSAAKPSQDGCFYQDSISKLKVCIDSWNASPDICFCIQIGDLIDGNSTSEETLADFEAVMSCFDSLIHPLYHVLGNHCLSYTNGRDELLKRLNMFPNRGYYVARHIEEAKHTFIVLDGTEISVNGRSPTDFEYIEARRWLDDHPADQYPYAVDYNAAISSNQLQWLSEQLEHARRMCHRVFLFCHYPIFIGGSPFKHQLWNADEVLEIIRKYRDVVVAWFAGHDHAGAFHIDPESGIVHLTMPAVLESLENSYALMRVYHDHVAFQGFGSCPSQTWQLK